MRALTRRLGAQNIPDLMNVVACGAVVMPISPAPVASMLREALWRGHALARVFVLELEECIIPVLLK